MRVKIITISGPSGVGKTTIVNKLIQGRNPKFTPVMSTTTRNMRHGDFIGEYEYVTNKEFDAFKEANDFLWEAPEFLGCRYGTRKSMVAEVLATNKIGVMILVPRVIPVLRDYLASISMLDGLVSFFVGGVNGEELRNRLIDRGDNPRSIGAKVAECANWFALAQQMHCFDEYVTNENEIEHGRRATKYIIRYIEERERGGL